MEKSHPLGNLVQILAVRMGWLIFTTSLMRAKDTKYISLYVTLYHSLLRVALFPGVCHPHHTDAEILFPQSEIVFF